MRLATWRALDFESVEVGLFCCVERLEIRYAVRFQKQKSQNVFIFLLEDAAGTVGGGEGEKEMVGWELYIWRTR